MSTYREHIPSRAFLVAPDYTQKSVVVGNTSYLRSYFKPYSVAKITKLSSLEKYHLSTSTATAIVDTAQEYDENTAYANGDSVKVSSYGVVFEAGADVPAGNHPLSPDSVDESGVPYWVEDDTIEELKIFDASAKTDLSTGAGIRISGQAFYFPDSIQGVIDPYIVDHISVMGIRAPIKANVRMFVQFYFLDIMQHISLLDGFQNRCNYYAAALIDSFEIDCSRRDRVSFAVPDFAGVSKPLAPDYVEAETYQKTTFSIAKDIYFDVFIEVVEADAFPMHLAETCDDGDSASYHPGSGLSVGFFSTGTRYELGVTQVGIKLGRNTTRKDETNYLERKTVKKAAEAFSIDVEVNGQDEHLEADYFFRVASETSHIIHAGVPEFDWRFVFGVIDGGMPIDHPDVNFMSVNGYGIAFFATDPLITQSAVIGWK